mgnify:CR=1 FL=1
MSEDLKRLIIEDEQKEIAEIINNLPRPEAQSSFSELPPLEGDNKPDKKTVKPDDADLQLHMLRIGNDIEKMRNEMRIIMQGINALGHGIQNSNRIILNETRDKFRELSLKVEGIKRDIGGVR